MRSSVPVVEELRDLCVNSEMVCDLTFCGAVECLKVALLWCLRSEELYDLPELSTVMGIEYCGVLFVVSGLHLGPEGTVKGALDMVTLLFHVVFC